jgi:hypothetical protein
MSTNPKLPGGKKALAELARLKFYWRDELSEAQKDFWRSRFASPDSQAELREEIRVKLKFNLRFDKQLTALRKFDAQLQKNEEEAEWAAHEEAQLVAQGLTGEALRAELLQRLQRRALVRGEDQKTALQLDLAERRFQFEQEQAAKATRADEEKALALVLEQSKAYPEVQQKFREAFAALQQAKANR